MFGKKRKQVAAMLPIPPRMLICIVVVCVVVAVLLLPDQETLLERQLRDEEWDKALVSLQGLPPTERAARPAYYAALELRLRRLSIAPDDREAFTSLLADALETASNHDYGEEFVDEIELAAKHSLSAKETYRLLAPHLASLAEPVRDRLRESLAKRALAEAEPLLALEIYQEHWRWHANVPEVVFHYINLARGAGKPTYALHALDHYEKGLQEPLLRHSRQLTLLKIQLLRETNQPGKAFGELERLYEASDPETRRELFPLLNETSVQSGNAAKLLDETFRLAEANEEDAPRWREMAQLASSAGRHDLAIHALEHVVRIAPRDGESAFKLGQFYEWSGRPNEAFDQYLTAASRERKGALDRLLALNPGLYRDVELAGAVRNAQHWVDLDEHGLTIARLFANLNEFERARAYYQALLERRGDDPAMLAEYGLLELDLGNLTEALALYRRAARADPDNTALTISIAEAQFRAGQYDAALETYRDLLHRKPSRNQLQNYLRLAESMGRIKEAAGVLAKYMTRADDVSREDYDRLAYFYGINGERAKLEELLEESVRKFPDHTLARKQLLYTYSDNGKPVQAARVLAGFPDLASDPELARFYIALLSDAKRYREIEQFIAQRLSPEMVEQLKLNEMLASVYYETGNTNAAKALYGRLHQADPGNLDIAMTYVQFLLDSRERGEAKRVLQSLPPNNDPRPLKLAAQLHAADREFKQALLYQRRYLETEPPDAGRDWGFLGDLLGERGDPSSARHAYRRAIHEMLATIAKIQQTNVIHAPIRSR